MFDIALPQLTSIFAFLAASSSRFFSRSASSRKTMSRFHCGFDSSAASARNRSRSSSRLSRSVAVHVAAPERPRTDGRSDAERGVMAATEEARAPSARPERRFAAADDGDNGVRPGVDSDADDEEEAAAAAAAAEAGDDDDGVRGVRDVGVRGVRDDIAGDRGDGEVRPAAISAAVDTAR